jgi:DNA-binding transcriptional MerR regulator
MTSMDRTDAPAPDAGGAPLYSPGWVARRLGVTPTTLRTWHHRYDLGPTGRSAGGHRRYSPGDLARLDRMLGLTRSGVAVAEAARLSHLGDAGPPSDAPVPQPPGRPARPSGAVGSVEDLLRAADGLDQSTTGRILADSLRVRGVLATWTDLVAPVLRRVGEQFVRTADGIEVEHVVTESVRAALGDVVRRDRRWARVRPVLIAAADGEQHVLPLHALAAALAELGRPSVLLGASVPTAALAAAVARVGPAAVFLWSQTPTTAGAIGPTGPALPAGRRPPVLVVGGPGWARRPPGWATARADDLPTALRACTDAASPA